jgi:hypothetical protein
MPGFPAESECTAKISTLWFYTAKNMQEISVTSSAGARSQPIRQENFWEINTVLDIKKRHGAKNSSAVS